MRAGKAIGVTLVVLVVAALAVLWQAPPVAAAGQQAVTEQKQAEKKIEKQVIVKKQPGGEPVVVTVTEQGGGDRVMSHVLVGDPMAALLTGSGPRLGVEIHDLAKDDLAKLKLATLNGVVIDNVTKDSAAGKAGVKAGDVVVQFDGENVRSAQQFTRLVRETVAGRTVKMAVMRDGKRVEFEVAPAMADETFKVTIDEEKVRGLEKKLEGAQEKMQQFRFERRAPAPGETPPPGGPLRWRQGMPMPEGDVTQWFGDRAGNLFFSTGRGRLGVTVQELTPELAGYFGVKDGVLVNSVQADTPAAKAGIKAGDVIGSVDGKAVTTSAELIKELAGKDGDVTIGVTRDKKPLSLKATLEARQQQLRRRTIVGKPA